MVPVIDPAESISDVLNYNEQKVQRGEAKVIGVGNFLKSAEQLNFYDKLQRFERLHELNQRVQVPVLHISLNFHPEDNLTEKNLQELSLLQKTSRKITLTEEELREIALVDERLREIAALYMDRIGFGNQPFIIYQHFDAGHPHIHIVTTVIRENGKRIDTRDIGKKQSVEARKEIDRLYGLRRVEDSQQMKAYEPEPVTALKAAYGKLPTKKAIKDVLRFVLAKYKFTSLTELNAVLRQYNVLADHGKPGSRIFKSGGLVYRVLSEKGKKIGAPVKASDIHFKRTKAAKKYMAPTLATLEPRFKQNKIDRQQLIPGIKGRIDWTLGKQPASLEQWAQLLMKENIQLISQRNDQGLLYGLTFIDYKTRVVLKGSDIGKEYSANAVRERFNNPSNPLSVPAGEKRAIPKKTAASKQRTSRVPRAQKRSAPQPGHRLPASSRVRPSASGHAPQPIPASAGLPLLHDPMAGATPEQVPYELSIDYRKKKKKKKIQL